MSDLGTRVNTLPRMDLQSRIVGATQQTRDRHRDRYAAMSDGELAAACTDLGVARSDIWRESPSLAALLGECARRLARSQG